SKLKEHLLQEIKKEIKPKADPKVNEKIKNLERELKLLAEKQQAIEKEMYEKLSALLNEKAEMEDLKKKLAELIHENRRLKEELETLMANVNPTPYIIE
ncbi:MAG: hypothetical protein GXN99_01310, partial [Candidatus Nanohaloarchaeota archaeon]|nr:hypothetical protein [Candidatus Nanohaloarchaeota archaeon]